MTLPQLTDYLGMDRQQLSKAEINLDNAFNDGTIGKTEYLEHFAAIRRVVRVLLAEDWAAAKRRQAAEILATRSEQS